MSSPLQNNTAELQSILDIVNNLPLANGNGGGGGANLGKFFMQLKTVL